MKAFMLSTYCSDGAKYLTCDRTVEEQEPQVAFADIGIERSSVVCYTLPKSISEAFYAGNDLDCVTDR